MTDWTITKRLEFDAGIDAVWRAITDPAELSLWFGDGADFDPTPGTDGAMVWENHGRYAVRVEESSPPNRLVWSWMHEPNAAFDSAHATRVEWSLSVRPGGGTALELRESGFLTATHYDDNNGGWDEELGELRTLLGAV